MDNVWATREAKDLARRAKKENPGLQVFYVASMMRRGNLFKACMELLESDEDVQMLKSIVSLRNAFPESQIYGATVHRVCLHKRRKSLIDFISDRYCESRGLTNDAI